MARKTIKNNKPKHVDGEPEFQKMATAAYREGIIGIFILHLLFGVFAITESNIAMKSKNPTTIDLARRANRLGKIDLAIGIVLIILYIFRIV